MGWYIFSFQNFLIRRDPIPIFSIPCWYFADELTKWVKSWAVLRDKELYIFDKEKFHTKYDHAISTGKVGEFFFIFIIHDRPNILRSGHGIYEDFHSCGDIVCITGGVLLDIQISAGGREMWKCEFVM